MTAPHDAGNTFLDGLTAAKNALHGEDIPTWADTVDQFEDELVGYRSRVADLEIANDGLTRQLYNMQQDLLALHGEVRESRWWGQVTGRGHLNCSHYRCNRLRGAMRRAEQLVASPVELPRRRTIVLRRRTAADRQAYIAAQLADRPELAALLGGDEPASPVTPPM